MKYRFDPNNLKMAFFDFDSTICQHGPLIATVPHDKVDQALLSGSYIYEDCYAPDVMKHIVADLQSLGIRLYVLTALETSIRYDQKVRFTRSNYDTAFLEVISCWPADRKIEVIQKYMHSVHAQPDQCLLVDDEWSVLTLADNAGIRTVHPLRLICDNIDNPSGFKLYET